MKFRNHAGRLKAATLPPFFNELAAEPVVEGVATGDRVESSLEEASRELAAGEAELDQVTSADRAAIASAAREGSPEPKDSTVKPRARVEQAGRLVEGRLQAVAEQADLVSALFDQHRDGFITAAEERREAHLRQLAEKVEAVIEEHRLVAELEAAIEWARHFPNGKVLDWRPADGHIWIGSERVVWTQVAESLRRNADPELRHDDPTRPKTMTELVEAASGPVAA